MPVSALKARLNGPSELKPASSAMVSTGTSACRVCQGGFGVGDPVEIQETVEVAVAQSLVDQPPQPVLRHPQPLGEPGDGEAVLAVGLVDGHGAFEGRDLDRIDRLGRRWRRRGSEGGRHGRLGQGREQALRRPQPQGQPGDRRDDGDQRQGGEGSGRPLGRIDVAREVGERRQRAVGGGGNDDEQPEPAAAFQQVVPPGCERRHDRQRRKDDGARGQRDAQDPVAGHAFDPAQDDHQQPERAMPPAQAEAVVEQRSGKQPEHDIVAGGDGEHRRQAPAERRMRSGPRADHVESRAERKGHRQLRGGRGAVVPQQNGGDQQQQPDGDAAQHPIRRQQGDGAHAERARSISALSAVPRSAAPYCENWKPARRASP